MHSEIEKLIDHSFEYAQRLLIDTKEFYPFGAYIDTIGNVHPLEFEFNPKKMPQVKDVIESLTKYCENEMADEKMNGYAITYESQVKMNEDDTENSCITISIKHTSETKIPTFYQPFNIIDETVEFEDIFGVK